MKKYKVFSIWGQTALFFFLFLSLALFYFSRQSLHYKAYQSLKNNKAQEATSLFKQTAEKNPSQLLNYLNLALSYDLNKQKKKAEEIYSSAEARFLNRDRHSFFLYFNKGEFYSRLESDPGKALQAYQKALQFNYKTDLIKKNIEWLFKNKESSKNKSSGGNQEKERAKENNKEKTDSENKGGGEKSDKKEAEGDKENEKTEPKNKEETEGDKENEKTEPKNKEEAEDKKENEKNQKEQKQEGGRKGGLREEEFNPEGKQDKPEEGGGLSRPFDFDRRQEIDEKAVLEEIQKQESKARSRFYKGKGVFGDKTDKNW